MVFAKSLVGSLKPMSCKPAQIGLPKSAVCESMADRESCVSLMRVC